MIITVNNMFRQIVSHSRQHQQRFLKPTQKLQQPQLQQLINRRSFAVNTPTQQEQQTTAATAPAAADPFRQAFLQCLNANNEGNLVEFVRLYHDLKSNYVDRLTIQHYNQLLASCAPSKLMFKWFRPYKDYVDMYHEAGKFKSDERMEEANRVLRDIEESPLNLRPDIVTYNTMMKVQMSGGYNNVVKVFDTFNQLQAVTMRNQKQADIISYTTLLRACSLLERVDIAEEIYSFIIHSKDDSLLNASLRTEEQALQDQSQVQLSSTSNLPIQFFNTMLDVYAEVASPYAETFFRQLLSVKMPVDAVTFNTYAKSCIFRDERIKLVEIPELMRVEGVLQRGLSQPVRDEIQYAYNKHTAPLKYKHENQRERFIKPKTPLDASEHNEDFFKDLREVRPWGRYVDLKDTKFLKLLEYTQLHKFTVDYDLIAQTTKIEDHPTHNMRPQ